VKLILTFLAILGCDKVNYYKVGKFLTSKVSSFKASKVNLISETLSFSDYLFMYSNLVTKYIPVNSSSIQAPIPYIWDAHIPALLSTNLPLNAESQSYPYPSYLEL